VSYTIPRLIDLREIDAVGECAAGFNEDSMKCYEGLSE